MPRYKVTRRRWGAAATVAFAAAATAGTLIAIVGGSGNTPDSLAPSLFITAPAADATISGTVTVSATCGDNVACTDVQFKLNGANLQDDVSSPFSISWDTTISGTGTFTLSAVGSDAAGHHTTSASRTVTVTPSGSTDLANIWLDPAVGLDTCTRQSVPTTYGLSSGHICATFNRAYAAMNDGDVAKVEPGLYSVLVADPSTARYFNSATVHATPVQFQCISGASNDSVTFDYQKIVFKQANGITFSGRCFRFNIPSLGEGGDSGDLVNNITFTNVHMSSFVLRGATNVTIQNSDVGPSVSCSQPSTYAGVDARECVTANGWPENLGAINDLQANDGNGQAQIGSNAGGQLPTGFVFASNYLHDFQGRNTPLYHEGCIQENDSGDLGGMVIRANTFERCAVSGVSFDHASGTDTGYSNLTIENNDFGPALETYDTSGVCCQEAGTGQLDLFFRYDNAVTVSNILIRYNSFSHGMNINRSAGGGPQTVTWANSRIIGNVMGKAAVCVTGTNLTYDRNVWPNASGGCGESNFSTVSGAYSATNPYNGYTAGSSVQYTPWQTPAMTFTLNPADTFLNSITETSSDYAISTDIAGLSRTAPRSPGANR